MDNACDHRSFFFSDFPSLEDYMLAYDWADPYVDTSEKGGVTIMTMHHLLIELTSKVKRLNIPPELEEWLLVEYGWEPVDDFWNATELMDIIEMHYEQYRRGELDINIPDDVSIWKNRAETTAYILKGIILEKDPLSDLCERFQNILDDNDIDY